LKAPFARPRDIYENLNEWHLPKIRTIGAPRVRAAFGAAAVTGGRARAADRSVAFPAPHPSTRRSPCNRSFTIQPGIHHAARMNAGAHANPAPAQAKIPPHDLP
jgi:hypothetical protein